MPRWPSASSNSSPSLFEHPTAYYKGVCRFAGWCESRGLPDLISVKPLHFAVCIEDLALLEPSVNAVPRPATRATGLRSPQEREKPGSSRGSAPEYVTIAGKLRPDSRHTGAILRLGMSIVFNRIWTPNNLKSPKSVRPHLVVTRCERHGKRGMPAPPWEQNGWRTPSAAAAAVPGST